MEHLPQQVKRSCVQAYVLQLGEFHMQHQFLWKSSNLQVRELCVVLAQLQDQNQERLQRDVHS